MEGKIEENVGPSNWDVFSTEFWENSTLSLLSWLQETGVLLSLIFCGICLVLRLIYKARKNVRLQQFWFYTALGMGFLWIFFTFLPYFVLHYMENG